MFYLNHRRFAIMEKRSNLRTTIELTILEITYNKLNPFRYGYEYWDSVILIRKLLIVMTQIFFVKYIRIQAVIFIITC